MAQGRRTDLPTAARATAMADLGFSSSQIAESVGLPEGTVSDIVHGRHGWGKIHGEPVFREYRAQQKRIMQTGSIELAKKALVQIENKLPEASAAQASVIYGILRDKERLDAGESTQNIAIIERHRIEGLDRLADALQQVALLRKSRSTQGSGNEGE